jgi:phenylacetic acid degradation protein
MENIYAIDGIIPVVDPTAFVHPTATIIGDVIVSEKCYVGPGVSLRGDMGRIWMKPMSNMQDNCIAHTFAGGEVVLEEAANVGHGAILHGCYLGKGVLIGMNAVIMDGATIGDYAFVAALAFIRAGFEVPAKTVAAGIPAKILRDLTEQELEWKGKGDQDYQEIIRRSHATLEKVTPLTSIEDTENARITEPGIPPLYQIKR